MNIKSRRFIIAMLVGMTVGLVVTIFIKPVCAGPILGIVVAAYIARVASAKEGAIVGVITFIPSGIYILIMVNAQVKSIERLGLLGAAPAILLSMIFYLGVGAVLGLIIGLLMRISKQKNWIA